MKSFHEQTFYELLDLPVTATAEEVRAAYDHAAEVYAADSMVLYTLVEPAQADALRARLREALETLVEPAQRAAYNRALGVVEALAEAPPANPDNRVAELPAPLPDPPLPVQELLPLQTPLPPEPAPPVVEAAPVAQAVAPVAPAPPTAPDPPRPREVRPKAPEVGPNTEFNGELLRQLREARGLSLQVLADRTRIGRLHLDNVEADRYGQLPPTVYLRGILTNVARELRVDPQWVCRSYLALVAASQKH